MTDAAAIPSAPLPASASAAWARPMVERQLAVLGRLAEAGLEIAVGLEGQAKGGPEVVPGDVAMAYSRVARAVRQTIMLQSRLIEALQDRDRASSRERDARRASAARILRGVIGDERLNDEEQAERLAREAAERLQQEDFADLLSRPFGEVVAGIVRDLGLEPDWLALAERCAAADGPGPGQGAGPAGQEYVEGPDGQVRVLWMDETSIPGETVYFDPDERYRRRFGTERDSS